MAEVTARVEVHPSQEMRDTVSRLERLNGGARMCTPPPVEHEPPAKIEIVSIETVCDGSLYLPTSRLRVRRTSGMVHGTEQVWQLDEHSPGLRNTWSATLILPNGGYGVRHGGGSLGAILNWLRT